MLATALVAAGCAGVKVVYDRLDVLLPWYFRDYLDLDTGQRGQLQRSVETLLAWHRESEVGRYAAFFRELSVEAAAPLPPGRLEAARLELETFWDDVAKRVAPDAAGLLATLSEAQVAEMFERIEREDAKLARESLDRSPEERVARRERSLRRQIERFIGGLDGPQRTLVRSCARELQGDTAGWLESRGRWQSALREAFSFRDDPPAFAARLERLFADGEEFWTPAYRDSFRDDRRRVLQLLEDIDRSLSAGQRARLQQRLTEWALDLESIAGGA